MYTDDYLGMNEHAACSSSFVVVSRRRKNGYDTGNNVNEKRDCLRDNASVISGFSRE
jgi:hypothetical protein